MELTCVPICQWIQEVGCGSWMAGMYQTCQQSDAGKSAGGQKPKHKHVHKWTTIEFNCGNTRVWLSCSYWPKLTALGPKVQLGQHKHCLCENTVNANNFGLVERTIWQNFEAKLASFLPSTRLLHCQSVGIKTFLALTEICVLSLLFRYRVNFGRPTM